MQELPPNCPYLPLDEQWNNTKERGFIGSAGASVLGLALAHIKTLTEDWPDANKSFVSLHAVDSMYQNSQLPPESSTLSQAPHVGPALLVRTRNMHTCHVLAVHLVAVQAMQYFLRTSCHASRFSLRVEWDLCQNASLCKLHSHVFHSRPLAYVSQSCCGQELRELEFSGKILWCAGRDGSSFKFDDKFISRLKQDVNLTLAAKLDQDSMAGVTAIEHHIEKIAARFLGSSPWPQADVL